MLRKDEGVPSPQNRPIAQEAGHTGTKRVPDTNCCELGFPRPGADWGDITSMVRLRVAANHATSEGIMLSIAGLYLQLLSKSQMTKHATQ